MRKLLLASAAISALAIGAVQAQESPVTPPNAPAADAATDSPDAASPDAANTTNSTNPNAETGAAVGIATGATAGAIVGGPIGAVVGGFAGAILGTAASVPEPAVTYAVSNPTPPVVIEGGVSEGVVIPESASLAPIPDYPEYAYVYVDGRPVIVKLQDRKVVYSPGYVVPEQTVTYVRSNPSQVVTLDGVEVGTVVPDDVQLVEIPSDPAYSYVYTDRGPVVVNRSSRTVVYLQN